MPNGGLNNFDISLVSNFDAAAGQAVLAADAAHIARANRFAHVDIRPTNHGRTCRHYGFNPDVPKGTANSCPQWRLNKPHARFPYQVSY